MKIETFASSSTGNAYRISDGHTTLLLECGIPFRKLQKYSGYALSEVSACLITHEHGDHAKAVGNLIDFGMPIWCSQGTAEKLSIFAGSRRADPAASQACALQNNGDSPLLRVP